MKPHYDHSDIQIYNGHVLDVLRDMKPESIHCVVTSPPYWGLRDYGLEAQVWDEPNLVNGCANPTGHEWGNMQGQTTTQWADGVGNKGDTLGDAEIRKERRISKEPCQGQFCINCNAWRGSLGLEPTPELYIQHMVQVFAEIKRVLRKDGCVFLNLGDSYAGSMKGIAGDKAYAGQKQATNKGSVGLPVQDWGTLKPKDLCGIPWRVALALQADGWWLRSDIIWSKPNPMPESVTDRPTRSHEYIFLLTKNAKYFYNNDAIREDFADERMGAAGGNPDNRKRHLLGADSPSVVEAPPHSGRNKRSVWTITTQPFPEAHFATFPEAIPKTCILAGCPEGGTVLDPFMGSGRTLVVAKKLRRKAIGIELNPKYCEMPVKGLAQDVIPFL